MTSHQFNSYETRKRRSRRDVEKELRHEHEKMDDSLRKWTAEKEGDLREKEERHNVKSRSVSVRLFSCE